MSYTIPVKIESLEKRRRMTGILHIIAGFYLLLTVAAWQQQQNFKGVLGAVPFALTALGAVIYGIRRKKIDPTAKYNSSMRGLEAMMMGMMALTQQDVAAYGLFAWAALSVMLLFSEKVLFQTSALELNEEGIQLPGSPRPPVLPWSELENIIVKPDFVTLFRLDKKYVQLELSAPLEESVLSGADSFGKAQIRKQAIAVS